MYNRYERTGMRPLYKWLIGIFIALVIIGLIIYFWFRSQLSGLEDSSKPLDEPALMTTANLKDNQSILLLGTDKPSNGNPKDVRTDTIMIATYNADNNTVKLLRLPRDIYVDSQGYQGKINGLYEHDGVEAIVKYINDSFDIPISDYAMVDFNGLEKVVDQVGGIDINSQIKIDNSNNDNLGGHIFVNKGHNHLNGKEALGYARIRYIDNDIKRGDRQTEVIKALADRMLKPSAMPKLPSVLAGMDDYVKTSMNADKIQKNIKDFSGKPKMTNMTFKWESFDKDGSSYVTIPQDEVDRLSQDMKKQLNIENSN